MACQIADKESSGDPGEPDGNDVGYLACEERLDIVSRGAVFERIGPYLLPR